MEEYQFLWRKIRQGAAEILRVYGREPTVRIPKSLQGRNVEKLASYCFSQAEHIPEGEHFITHVWVDEEGSREKPEDEIKNFTAVAGELLQEVVLPDTLTELGANVFYNCKKLERMECGAALRQIESDVFMNAWNFHEMTVRCSPSEKTGLKQMLAQISSDMEVIFLGKEGREAALLYPEYYESYDEIAPAHLFGRSITGEGFRARQSFREGRVEFLGYDGIFPKALGEESEKTLSTMALNRLMYPYSLTEQNRKMYGEYLSAHVMGIAKNAVNRKDLEVLGFLCRNHFLTANPLMEVISYAAGKAWAEGVAALMDYGKEERNDKRKNRYEFEEF